MNTKLYNIYGFITIFPVWVFKLNLVIIDLSILFLFFTILPILIHKIILRNYTKNKSNMIYIWLSLITFYSLDQNLGLWNLSQDFTLIVTFTQFFRAIYFSLFLISFFILVFFLLKQNALKIFFSLVLTIFIFNIFDSSKNFSNFPEVDLSYKKQKNNENIMNRKLVIIFDEMSGLNSLDSNVENGEFFNQYIFDYFLKNNFDIYTNAFSLFKGTDESLSSLFNFIKNKEDYVNIDKSKETHFISKSNNYYVVKDLLDNKFFDLKDNKNIVVQQSMYLNFCDHPKVIICNQFNPFNRNLTFLKGFKDTKLTKYVSLYRNNGSILSRLIWRSLLEIRAIDTLLDPDGEKASIQYIFDQLLQSIKSNKDTTLFFSHILVPHIPYGFTKNCEYDGGKTTNFNKISLNQKRTQHNLEKYCLIKYLDKLFKEIKIISEFKDLEIVIFSDHDSRIDLSQNENNVIYVHKKKGSENSNIIEHKLSINELFYNLNFN